jgi:predicted molibdopterin-dependent oxidoreductase YjgC
MVDKRKTICLFCSLGCGVAFRTSGGQITAIDYDRENPVNQGSLCPRGYYNLELINHPQRLTRPQIGKRKVSWDEAVSFAKRELKKFDPSSIGIALSSMASNEDAYTASLMANSLGIKIVASVGDPADIEAFEGNKWSVEGAFLENVERIGESNVFLIIGDILTRSPVLSKRINQVKYGKRGNQIIVIDPNVSHTSWFATTHLKNRPGTEALLMAAILKVLAEENKREIIDIDLQKVSQAVGIPAESIIRAAKSFDEAESGTIIFAPGKNIQRNDLVQYFVKAASSFSINKKHITFYSYGNALGVNTIIDSMVEGREKNLGGVKALISLGEDAAVPGVKFTVRSGFFTPDTLDENTVLLPLASHIERKGNVTMAGKRNVNFKPIAHKVGGRSNVKIINSLADIKMDFDETLNQTSRILAGGIKEEKVDMKQKISEARDISARPSASPEDITHFGDNELVKRFFWYRVNNKTGDAI